MTGKPCIQYSVEKVDGRRKILTPTITSRKPIVDDEKKMKADKGDHSEFFGFAVRTGNDGDQSCPLNRK